MYETLVDPVLLKELRDRLAPRRGDAPSLARRGLARHAGESATETRRVLAGALSKLEVLLTASLTGDARAELRLGDAIRAGELVGLRVTPAAGAAGLILVRRGSRP